MNNKLTVFTKGMLDFMFYGGILVTVTLPATFYFYGKVNDYFAHYYWQLLILFVISGIMAIMIVNELRKMFRTVLKENCFVMENVKSLKHMGTYSFVIAVVTLCRITLYLTPSVFILVLVFLIAGIFSKVLASVFEQAVSYKLENDLTI